MTDRAAENTKLDKADEFLQMAGFALDLDSFDAAVSLAVSAAINASDALLLRITGGYPSGANHESATSALRAHGYDAVAGHLGKCLRLKTRAQYEARRCKRDDAERTVEQATRTLSQVRRALGRS